VIKIRLAAALLLTALLLPAMVQAGPSADWIKAPGATAELVQEPVFGGRIAFYRAGPADGAEAVVLVHGMGKAAARDWEQVIPVLAKRYAVYAVDLPGFGESDKGNHHYSPDNLARALDAVLTPRLKQPFTLIGHSMGGAVTLAYASAYPKRVSRLVLVDVAGVLHRSVYAEFLARVAAQRAIGLDSPWYEQVVRAIQLRAEYWPVRGDLVLERASIRQRFLRGDPNAIAAFALVEHDFSDALRHIVAPTLIIWGGDDTIAPLRTGQALAAGIPNARLTVIEGAGHAPQVQFPDRFNSVVVDELDGRQFAAPSYALRTEEIQGERVGKCDGQRGQEFTGDYARLVISHCQDAHISNARIGYLQVANSTVRVVNTHVRDGIDAKNTRLEITASVVSGSLVLDASNVDAAGTTFVQAPAIATNEGAEPVVLRFSISTVSRSGSAPLALHDIVYLAPNETLIR
jgi:pimeloyl-ACP methyl ester carboxylesterase